MDPNRCFECLAEIPAGSKCLTVCDACWGKVESSVASPLERATGSEPPTLDELLSAFDAGYWMSTVAAERMTWLRAALPGLLKDRDRLEWLSGQKIDVDWSNVDGSHGAIRSSASGVVENLRSTVDFCMIGAALDDDQGETT